MGKRDRRVDAYIEKAAPFARPILTRLRKVVHASCPEVQETIKWQFPHFDYKGIMCGMAAFKSHCSFGFWKGSLIFGERTKEDEAMGQFGRLTSINDLPADKILTAYVRKAAKLNDEGVPAPWRKTRKARPPLKAPSYFTAALNKNAKAKRTFDNFTASNRREYIEWVTEAKREETRQARMKTAIAWMADGKTRNWKYER